MYRLLLLIFFAVGAVAQDYIVLRESALSAAAEAITVQQPTTLARTLRFSAAWVDCSVACTVTISRNGTAASSTALTPVPLNVGSAAAAATGWRSSNVGAGTVIGTFALPAGAGTPVNLSGVVLTGNGNTKNVTVSVASLTGTVHIMIRWTEGQ